MENVDLQRVIFESIGLRCDKVSSFAVILMIEVQPLFGVLFNNINRLL